MDELPSHPKTSIALQNWLYAAETGIVSAAIIMILIYVFPKQVSYLLNFPGWIVIAGMICILAVVIGQAQKRWSAFFGIRHFATTPPIWVASLIGAAITFLFLGFHPEYLGETFSGYKVLEEFVMAGLVCGNTCIVLFVCSLLWVDFSTKGAYPFSSQKQKDRTQPPSTVITIPNIKSFPELEEWLTQDDEIKDENGDLFDHVTIARRIIRRIVENPTRPPAQALIGRLGAGKTTIMRLVKDQLAKSNAHKNIHIVSVGLWPYETTHAAVIGIIRSIIEELGKEVNIVGLKDVPDAYVQAMSAAGGFWTALSHLVKNTPKQPIDTLKQISSLLEGIDHHFIIWIEDLERFVGSHKTYSEGELDHESERLNPIRALLYSLDTLPNLAVITATTDLIKRFDLDKIARYIERIPRLQDKFVEKVVCAFRQGYLQDLDFVDTAKPSEREKIGKFDHDGRDRLARMLGYGEYTDISQALFSLCSTPRILKQGLRRCRDFWKQYKGEIDFDDLLVMAILRESEPDLFALIEKNIYGLRIPPHGDGRANVDKAFEKALENTELHSLTQQEAKEIVKFLFDSSRVDKPQGIAQRDHMDYWERFLTEPELQDDNRDQVILKMMLSGDDTKLLDAFRNEKQVGTVEYFNDLLPDEQIKRLLTPFVHLSSQENPKNWREEPTWFIPFWRILLARKRNGKFTAKEILEQIKPVLSITIPKNMKLASLINHYFIDAFQDENNGLLTDSANSYNAEAHEYLQKCLLETCTGKPDVLASGFKGADPWSLFQLCYKVDRDRTGEIQAIPFTDWAKLTPTILEAARSHPQEMLPQIAGLVVYGTSSVSHEGRRHQYVFRPDIATLLFGNSDQVRTLFANVDIASLEDDVLKAMVRAIQQ